MASLKRNTAANFAGRGWTAFLAFLFVPVYVNVLGIESWGLIGFYATIQALLNLLDMGLSATLNRELARLSVRQDSARAQRDLVRTLEAIYWAVALGLGLLVLAGAPLVARHWLQSSHLPVETVTGAIRMMGLVFIFQFPYSLYQGGLMGLQRQVLLNGILCGAGTLRHAGAVAVILWISPTIGGFFSWQLAVSVLQVFTLRSVLWALLPQDPARPRFRKASLVSIWRFAAGLTAISLVTVLLLNLDKALLSKLLPLADYGYYMVGWSASNGIQMLYLPFYLAAFPRFSQMIAANDREHLAGLYHLLCQAVAVVVLPVAGVVAAFSAEFLAVWTRNPEVIEHSHPLVTLLVIGTALNALSSIPYALQLASGWTRLAFCQNLISTVLAVPALIVSARLFGGVGAASVWVVLNVCWILITPHFMHRRLLTGEKRAWYLEDVARPLLGVAVVVGISRALVPVGAGGLWVKVLVLGATWAVALAAAILAAPRARGMLGKTLGTLRKAPNARF